jgi:hypothetical protein
MYTSIRDFEFNEPEEATDLLEVTPAIEEEDTDVIPRPEGTRATLRDTRKDGSDFAFLFRLN